MPGEQIQVSYSRESSRVIPCPSSFTPQQLQNPFPAGISEQNRSFAGVETSHPGVLCAQWENVLSVPCKDPKALNKYWHSPIGQIKARAARPGPGWRGQSWGRDRGALFPQIQG